MNALLAATLCSIALGSLPAAMAAYALVRSDRNNRRRRR